MNPARIMIVEDENIIAMDLRMRLQALGYTIVAMAATGEDAIRQAEAQRPDLALMDIVLRGALDGIQATEQVQGRLGIPVIYVTAYSDETTVQRARLTEPYGYVLKPFEDRELKTVIEMVLYKAAMERRLRESEARFRLLAENATDMIARHALDGKYLYVSPACVRLLGYAPEEMLDKSAYDFVHPADIAPLTQAHQKLPASGIVSITMRVRRRDDTYLWMEAVARLIRDATGAPQEIQVAARDVSKRKQAEETQQRLIAILEATPDLVGINMPDGKLLYLNQAGRKMLGIAPDQDLSQVRFFEFLSAEQAYQLHRDGFPDNPIFDTWRGEVTLTNRQQQTVPVSLVGLNHRSSEGTVAYTSAIARDISEQKKAERELYYLSTHDALTGLYNRAYFETELARLEKTRYLPVSVVMVDVDGLKIVNDQQGHAAGDDLLKRAAHVLRLALRTEDIVARIGGDEFAIILPSTNAADGAHLVDRVNQALAEHNRTAATGLSLSLGVATQSEATPLTEVLRQADALMYQAKAAKHARQSNQVF